MSNRANEQGQAQYESIRNLVSRLNDDYAAALSRMEAVGGESTDAAESQC